MHVQPTGLDGSPMLGFRSWCVQQNAKHRTNVLARLIHHLRRRTVRVIVEG